VILVSQSKESALALQQIYDPVIIYAVRFQSSIQKKRDLVIAKHQSISI